MGADLLCDIDNQDVPVHQRWRLRDQLISSSYIRQEFTLGGEPRYLLPEVCYQYIIEHKLYRKINHT